MRGDSGQGAMACGSCHMGRARETSTPAGGTAGVLPWTGKALELFSDGLPPPGATPKPAPQTPALHCFSGPSPQQPTTSFLHRREKPICSFLPSSLGESLAPFRGQSLRREVANAKEMSLTFDIKQSMLPVSAWLISCVTLDKSLSLAEPQQGK